MTSDARREENQRLADQHQAVLKQMADLGDEIKAAGDQMTPAFEARLERLKQQEKDARAAYDAAREGWHETILVKPFR